MPRSAVRALFPVAEAESEPDRWSVRFDALHACHVAVAGDAARVGSLVVHRPCAHPALWDALLRVMRMGAVVLFFPGGAAPLVADEGAAAHLPPEMVPALGAPRVAASGAELARAVRGA